MLSPLPKAILETIIYADIFDYPLTPEEIGRWLIGFRVENRKFRMKNIKNVQKKDGYYFLRGRENIVDLRKQRRKWSEEKLKTAQEIGSLLKLVPIVKLVGITGALAVDNAKKDDDIDLFIVTSHGLLWITRLLTTLLIEITGKRRHPGEESVNNKICLNMFADEGSLEIPQREQDLFSAHEVAQLELLWDRDDTYKKFINANRWVKKYLPNAVKGIKYKVSSIKYEREKEKLIEESLRKFQLWYMRNRRTKEIIRNGIIRFHPHDARVWVIREYKKRLKLFPTV